MNTEARLTKLKTADTAKGVRTKHRASPYIRYEGRQKIRVGRVQWYPRRDRIRSSLVEDPRQSIPDEDRVETVPSSE